MKRILWMAGLALVTCCVAPYSQGQITLRGSVTDLRTGTPLPGVTVQIEGTTRGTVTALDGHYTLERLDTGTILVFRFLGYQEERRQVPAESGVLNVALDRVVFGLDEVVIVGSRRRERVVSDAAVPVDVLSPRDLEAQASTDMDDVLRTQIPSYHVLRHGIGDEATIVRPAALRGLPTDNVIVLVNGHRRHRSGSIALSGSSLNEGAQGPDLNMIPAIALSQVELLRDAATAQYGADAVAGVLSLRLREANSGLNLRMQSGQYMQGDGRYAHIAANKGLPLPSNGFINLSLEYRTAGPTIRSAQRDDARTLASRGYPVNNPAQIWGNPDVNYGLVGFANAGWDVTPHIRAYTFGGGGRRQQDGGFFFRAPGTATARTSVFRFGGQRAVVDLADGDDIDCQNLAALPSLDASFDQVETFINDYKGKCYLFNELFPGGFTPRFGADVYDASLTAGLRSKPSNGLQWDLSVSAGRSLVDYFIYNTVNASYGPDTPTSFDPRAYLQQEAQVSAAFSWPLQLERLASPVNLAWGLTWRTEIFESRAGDVESWKAGPYAAQGFSVGSNGYQGLNPTFAGRWSRPNVAVYFDAEADITQSWLLNAAVRYENFYSEFGGTLNGKLATRLRAAERIILRGTVSTGFRAPTPGQANLNVFRTTGFSATRGLIEVGLLPSVHPIAQALGGKTLTPERARSLSIGAVAELGTQTTLTLDFFNVAISDRLALTGSIPLTDEIVRIVDAADLLGGVTNIREVRFYANDFSTRSRGFDAILDWQLEAGQNAEFAATLAWNWTAIALTRFTPPGQISSFLGQSLQQPVALSLLTRQRQIEIERLAPRNRLIATTRAAWKSWQAMVRVSWFDEWSACRFRSATCRLDDGGDGLDVYRNIWLTDMELGYKIGLDWQVSLGMFNVFDANRSAHPQETGRTGNLYSRSTPFDYNGTAAYLRITARLN